MIYFTSNIMVSENNSQFDHMQLGICVSFIYIFLLLSLDTLIDHHCHFLDTHLPPLRVMELYSSDMNYLAVV